MGQRFQVLAGLGNPGKSYSKTRHNVGVWLVNQLAQQQGLTFDYSRKLRSYHCTLTLADGYCFIIRPNIYMNHSGDAISKVLRYFKVPIESLTVAHDELDFPPGRIRWKTDGGHGGHNGLRDIINQTHQRNFQRLRIGIGHPGHSSRVVTYVLSEPKTDERAAINKALDDCIKLIPDLLDPSHHDNAKQQLHTRAP